MAGVARAAQCEDKQALSVLPRRGLGVAWAWLRRGLGVADFRIWAENRPLLHGASFSHVRAYLPAAPCRTPRRCLRQLFRHLGPRWPHTTVSGEPSQAPTISNHFSNQDDAPSPAGYRRGILAYPRRACPALPRTPCRVLLAGLSPQAGALPPAPRPLGAG